MIDTSISFPIAGNRRQGLLSIASPLFEAYQWPYIAISGAFDGPTLCLLSGIHGAEYPPIDALLRFCRALDPATLHGRIVAMPVANLPAFWERTPFVCPVDGKNPNRVFPGVKDGSFSEVLAYHLFHEVIRRGDYLIDLHCGDMVEDLAPFSLMQYCQRPEIDEPALSLAKVFGLSYVVAQPPVGGPIAGTTNGAAAQAGIPAIIAEAGAIGQLQPEAVAQLTRGLQRSLQHLQMLEGIPETLPEPTVISEFAWLRVEKGGFFRKSIVAGQILVEGQVIGEMVDLWGEPQATIRSTARGVVLFATTSPAIKDGGLLAGIGVLP